jgi:diguanylate cyclase (GGDEF)-like protein
MIIPASEMYVGECAELMSLCSESPEIRRLKSMGLREGRLIDLLHHDPVVSRKLVLGVDGTRLAFPAELAAGIMVRPLKSFFEALKQQAHYDSLTGCFNRHAAHGIIQEELEKFAGKGVPFSLLLADIDHFKKINDGYGHQTGDSVLKGIAGVMRKGLRRCDVLSRWGGKEFLILLRGTLREEAKLIAERLRGMVEENVFDPFASGGLVTVSIGGCGMPPGKELERLFAEADSALYASKSKGRNRVTMC